MKVQVSAWLYVLYCWRGLIDFNCYWERNDQFIGFELLIQRSDVPKVHSWQFFQLSGLPRCSILNPNSAYLLAVDFWFNGANKQFKTCSLESIEIIKIYNKYELFCCCYMFGSFYYNFVLDFAAWRFLINWNLISG